MTQTTTPLFKRAFVRGINAQLMQAGVLAYPTKEAADYAADYVADHVPMPDPVYEKGVMTLKHAQDLAVSLTKAAEFLSEKMGGASAELSKQAAAIEPDAQARVDAFSLMQKAAMETEGPNSVEQSAQLPFSAGATADAAARPTGYAVSGVGNYIDSGRGAIGDEAPADAGLTAEGGTNSAIQASKVAAAALRKAAGLPDKHTGPANTLANAANTNGLAALDQKNRPHGYALAGVGNSAVNASGSAVLGKETSTPPKSNSPSGSNSVSAPKTAADLIFERTAELVVPFLPAGLPDTQKLAHVKAIAPLSRVKQASYLAKVASTFGLSESDAGVVAEAFTKAAKAKDEGEDDYEVAQALEAAAGEIEGKAEKLEDSAVDKLKGKDDDKTAEVLSRLSAAVTAITAPKA